MADANVVRDMSETLAMLLQAASSGIVAPTDVRAATPDNFHDLEPTPWPTCTVFLYGVAVNPVMRNGPRMVLPDGATSQPPLPMDLSYLITPWAEDPRDEDLILGTILQGLYDRAERGATRSSGTPATCRTGCRRPTWREYWASRRRNKSSALGDCSV
jgi:hypothetical protein